MPTVSDYVSNCYIRRHATHLLLSDYLTPYMPTVSVYVTQI